jgi:thiosulfate/3-mercaptopyruvate sulfurtransferase
MNDQPLMPPAALADALGQPDLAMLDIRSSVDGGGRAAFEAGHVPGAIHTDYVADGWRMEKDGAGGLLPDPEALSNLFGRLGLTPESRVVIVPAGVSSGDFSAAARVYWTLKTAGLRHLSILDGGFARWTAEGHPVETGPGRRPYPTSYPIRLDASRRAELREVERAVAAGQGGPTLLDTRGPKSFAGEEKSSLAKRAGRLPGAINVESARAYDPAVNRLRPLPELEQLFAPVPEGAVVTYCNTGQLASTGWFVLSELLGRKDVAMYDGSMSQWTQDEKRPVETGPLRAA